MKKLSSRFLVSSVIAITMASGLTCGRAVALDCNDVADCKEYWCFSQRLITQVYCFVYINAQAWENVRKAEGSGSAETTENSNTRIVVADCEHSCASGTFQLSAWCDVEPGADFFTIDETECQL
jgi:hypothetical protein